MKKLIAIACVLLLLVIFTGVERFKRIDRSEPNVTTQTGPDAPSPLDGRKVRTPNHSETTANAPSETDPIPVTDVGADLVKAVPVSSQSPSGSGNVALGKKISEIYYIRGRSVLGASEPSKESIAKLLEAVKQVASGFEQPVIVFDLDGLATSQSPFLVFASPGFDLTKAVEVAYRVLIEKDAAPDPEK